MNDRIIIQGCSEATDVTNWSDFSDEVELLDYDVVLYFINKMINEGQMGNYMKSLFEFFRINSKISDKGYQYRKVFDLRNKKD